MFQSRSSSLVSMQIVTLVFSIIGVIFLAVGAGFAMSSVSLLWIAERTEGQVIRLVQNHQPINPQNHHSVAPVVEFHLNGDRHEFESWLSTSPPQFAVNDKVTVLYDPRNLRRASIDSFVTLWLFPTIFGGIGAIFGAVAILLFVLSRRRQSATSPDSEAINFLDERTET